METGMCKADTRRDIRYLAKKHENLYLQEHAHGFLPMTGALCVQMFISIHLFPEEGAGWGGWEARESWPSVRKGDHAGSIEIAWSRTLNGSCGR